MPSLTKTIPKDSDVHRALMRSIQSRVKLAQAGMSSKLEKFQKAEDTVLAYVPESELDAQRRAKREQDGEPKYTTIQIPYTYALLMAAHTYLTSVFFARSPVHQFSGRHGETEQQVQALEAVMDYQVSVGEMLGRYYIWIYDALKYGVGVIEEYWDNEELQFASIEEHPDPTDPTGEKKIKVQVRSRMPGYQGNRITNIRPSDFLPDPRVTVADFQSGEFVFVRKRLSWETIVRRKAQGYYMNTDHLKKGAAGDSNGTTVSSQLSTPDSNVGLVATDTEEKHPSIVDTYEGCVSIIPKEWRLGESDFPEKWMFTITADFSTIIGCQPHGAMHSKFPYEVLESEIEGYGTFNRGLPEIIQPIQQTMDWLINQHFFNVRAALNNQFILDPSKIVAKDAETGGPGFTFRLRPEAYGQDIRTFFHQIPVADVTRGHVADVNTMLGIGERVFGINDQILGAMMGTSRKTATEVRTSTGFGVNRLKTQAEYMSATGFSRHAQRLVQNTQQYLSAERKYKIAGTLLADMGQSAAERFLSVNPDSIQGFYDFVPVDGTLPVDRLALANLWKELLLQMRNVPGLLGQYDLGRIFAHVSTLAGVRNLNQFKIQIGSPQALAQQAEAGNVVPLRGGQASPGGNSAGVPAAGPLPTGSPYG